MTPSPAHIERAITALIFALIAALPACAEDARPCVSPTPTSWVRSLDPVSQRPLAWPPQATPCIAVELDPRPWPYDDPAPARAAIDDAFHAWSSPACADALCFDLRANGATTTPGFDGHNALLFARSAEAWPYSPDAFAATLVTSRSDDGAILDADILLNTHTTTLTLSPPPEDDPRAAYLPGVATHEIGHLLGLAHTTLPESTMYGDTAPGETLKATLAPVDLDAVCTLYREACEGLLP